MSEDLSIEQRIAKFLDINNIAVSCEPFKENDYEFLKYTQFREGELNELGSTLYHSKTGRSPHGTFKPHARNIEGFYHELISHVSKLLKSTHGDYEHDRWMPIRKASIRVTARYLQKEQNGA